MQDKPPAASLGPRPELAWETTSERVRGGGGGREEEEAEEEEDAAMDDADDVVFVAGAGVDTAADVDDITLTSLCVMMSAGGEERSERCCTRTEGG